MSPIPSNYLHNVLYPKIVIKNAVGSVVYTHESKAIYPSGIRDFEISSFRLKLGCFDNYGSLILIIPDFNNTFTDISDLSRPSDFGREFRVEMDLGVTSSDLNRYFDGKIKDSQIYRPGTNQQELILTCIGSGVITKERMTKLVRNQDKTSDGITLDDTDTKTRIDNLLLDIFQDKDHQIDENIPQLTTITAATTTNGLGICGSCTSTKIANVNFGISTYAQAVDSLVQISNTMWRINEDRKLVVHDPSAHNSGMLFTNDLTVNSESVNWNQNKRGWIRQAPISWSDTSIDTFYNWIHGWGHFTPVLDSSDGQTPDASDNLDTMWHAIPFTMKTDNLFKITQRIIKTGTPITPTTVEIWGQDGTGKPDVTDIRRSIQISKERLQSLGTSTPTTWFEIPLQPRMNLVPNEQLFIVWPIYGTAAHTININYKSGIGTYYDSSDGITWTARTGASAYRVYSAKRLISSLEITDTTTLLPEPRERMFPIRSDLEEQTVRQTLLSIAETLGKQRRVYSNMIVSIPKERVNLGQSCRIIDRQTGLDIKANMMGLEMSASRENRELGVTVMDLTLEEFLL